MNIVIFKDSESMMLSVEVNQKTIFYGNNWDFDVPKDLKKLLDVISNIDPIIKVTLVQASMEAE